MPKPPIVNPDSEVDKLIKAFDADLAVSAALRKTSLSTEELKSKIDVIEKQLLNIESSKFSEVEDRILKAKDLITKIHDLQAKLTSHTNFSDLVDAGGLIGLREKYEASLLSLFHRADDICKSKTSAENITSPLSDLKQATSVINSLNLFKQAYKVQKAYHGIYTGLKYKKAEFTELLNAKDIKVNIRKKIQTAIQAIENGKTPEEVNPIKMLSRRNIKALKQALSDERSALIAAKKVPITNNKFGLLADEIDLFAALLDLPYKLQHGTNHFSDIARTGRLDSLAEIHRHRPKYESPFSTPGNLQELGNEGFIFFRCYVDGVNSDQTRYGNTRMITDISLLREFGWVSLHDQLVPFSNHNRQQTLYEGNRLLFKATPADINNKAQKNKSADGIRYTYRATPILSYETGGKDTQKSFGKTIATTIETIKFTTEIFYGQDILPGIALSIIHRLRKLSACGYRQKLLGDFNDASELKKTLLLGKIVKDFYRIEGKYPLGLPFEYDKVTQQAFFKPVAGSDKNRKKNDRRLFVENPEGDGRYNIDLSVNTENAKLAYLNEKLLEADSKISVLQKQVVRTQTPEDTENLALYKRRKTELEEKLQTLSAETEKYILAIAEVCTEQDLIWIRKRSYEFLKIVTAHFVPLIQNNIITVKDLQIIPLQKLAIIAHETWIDLLYEDKELWPVLLSLSVEELKGMAKGNIAMAMSERGHSFEQLIALFREDKDGYSYATCDDLQELVYEHSPCIPKNL